MSKLQIIFVVETSSEDKSDTLYLREVLNYYFTFTSEMYDGPVATKTICLNGKQNYKDKKILNHISNQISLFASQNPDSITKVIYFMDTDSVDKEYKPGSFFYNVRLFCEESGFELVWFCKNAENVFLGKEPEQLVSKTKSAKQFVWSGGITKISKHCLMKDSIEYGCSNILNVLAKYLKENKHID